MCQLIWHYFTLFAQNVNWLQPCRPSVFWRTFWEWLQGLKIGRWDWFMWVKLKTNQNWVFANRNGWWRRWWRWWWMIVMYLDLWEFGPHSIRKLFGHRPYLHMNNHNVVNPKKAIIVTIPTFTRKCLLPDLRTVEVYGIGWRKAIRQSIDFPQMISLSYPYHIPIIPLAGKTTEFVTPRTYQELLGLRHQPLPKCGDDSSSDHLAQDETWLSFFFLGWITARWLQRKSLSWYSKLECH